MVDVWRVVAPPGWESGFTGTQDECWRHVQRAQAQSVDWALKWGGWKIEPVVQIVVVR